VFSTRALNADPEIGPRARFFDKLITQGANRVFSRQDGGATHRGEAEFVHLETGLVLAQRFRLEQELGRGGAGVVWSAEEIATGERCAIKVLVSLNRNDRRRFAREARAARAVDHPAVVAVRELIDLPGDVPAIVMELLTGEDLRRRLEREPPFSVGEAASLLRPVAAALCRAHGAGIVHRDIKPENIFLCPGSAGSPVRVLDFGVAKIIGIVGGPAAGEVVTVVGKQPGTLAYMAPECLIDDATVEPSVDIWSLGVVLFECLTGVRPVEGETDLELAKRLLADAIPPLSIFLPDVPGDVGALVASMLSRTPAERPDAARIEAVLAAHIEANG
jgi:serine/threonine-protein kinase